MESPDLSSEPHKRHTPNKQPPFNFDSIIKVNGDEKIPQTLHLQCAAPYCRLGAYAYRKR